MDRLDHALGEATAFKRENRPACAYFKYVRAISYALDLLTDVALFGTRSASRSRTEDLFKLCSRCVERSEELLEAVLDLDEEETEKASEASILGYTTYLRERPPHEKSAVTMDAPAPYLQVTNTDDGDGETSGGHAGHHHTYGEEPPLTSVRHEHELPLIPASSLWMAHCQCVLEVQLIVQRLNQFLEAASKQQANALFLANVRVFLERLARCVDRKYDLEEGLLLSRSMHLMDVNPSDVARQITLLQHFLLSRLPVEEVRLARPGSDLRGANLRTASGLPCPNLVNFLTLSQYWCHWAQYEVLRWARAAERASQMGHLIRTALALRDMANLDGCRAIVTGLTARPVERLRQTKRLIPRRLLVELDNLRELVSERRHHARLLEALRRRTAPVIPPIAVLYQEASELTEPFLAHWSEYRSSAYGSLFKAVAVPQDYLLSQPFRWEEELMAISLIREPPVSADKEESIESVNHDLDVGERYEQMQRRFEGGGILATAPASPTLSPHGDGVAPHESALR